jgi:hypothetical protein
MIERDRPDDEDALWEISGLIGEHMPETPADIKPAARRRTRPILPVVRARAREGHVGRLDYIPKYRM